MRILLIEDDAVLRQVLTEALEKETHHVVCGNDGLAAVRLASRENFDAMVLDRLLPKLDGLGVMQKLKLAGRLPPTIIVSALNTPFNRAEGLQAGAHDYLGKPFSLQEFLARLAVLGYKGNSSSETMLRYADMNLDLLNMRMRRADTVLMLKQLEFRLLRFFMRQPEILITRESLHLGVWGYAFDPATNIVEVQISRLRKKLNMPQMPRLLHTVRGRGYMLAQEKPTAAQIAKRKPEPRPVTDFVGITRCEDAPAPRMALARARAAK